MFQVRIFGGDRRETYQCLHPGIGQHFDIDPVILPVSQSVGVIQVVPLGTFVDNIDVDVVTGHLWVAGHPDDQLLVNHMPWPHTPFAPSQVLRLSLSEDSTVTDIAEVYYNDGRQISGSSVAVHYRRYMLVGSIFTKLLLCEVYHA
ncbi:hypothetical protein LSAT2_015197 [Lamellibrachia satsuma]|nr:hypothetical protein LSAT2_015197 [Lamellibrachia satsuma]